MTVNPLEAITKLVSSHPAASWRDPKNGPVPLGFVKGAALSYGRLYCKYKANNDAAAEYIARANTNNVAHDALAYYAPEFAALKLDNSQSGVDTLRHTFILACALPGPDSSWRWWVGVDTTNASSETADTAEAGLCQTSWNSNSFNRAITVPLFEHYLKVDEPLLWRDVFSEGTGGDENHAIHQVGSGQGAVFQALSKLAPPFALEYAAVVLRGLRGHYGTIRDRKVVLNPHMDDLFQQVEKIIAASPEVAASLSDTPIVPVVQPTHTVPAPTVRTHPPVTTTTTTNTATAAPDLTTVLADFSEEHWQTVLLVGDFLAKMNPAKFGFFVPLNAILRLVPGGAAVAAPASAATSATATKPAVTVSTVAPNAVADLEKAVSSLSSIVGALKLI